MCDRIGLGSFARQVGSCSQSDREVATSESSRFAQENGALKSTDCLTRIELMHMETSARTGENVEESFLKCARAILTKIESGMRSAGSHHQHVASDFDHFNGF